MNAYIKPCTYLVALSMTLMFSPAVQASNWGWDRTAEEIAQLKLIHQPNSTHGKSYSSYGWRQSRAYQMTRTPTIVTREPVSFKAGEKATVAGNAAQLMLGDQVLGTLAPGQQVIVLNSTSDWIGVSADSGGKQITGWILRDKLAPVTTGPSRSVPQTVVARASRSCM